MTRCPSAVRDARGLMPYSRALELIHRPTKDSDWGAARKALRFQEAFVLQAALLQQRARLRATAATAREPGAILEGFDAALPFALTGDQQLVGAEIARDLAADVPMNRLVQGEVGSGKTLVALRAMLAVAQSGGQSALLAPTEVLAHQHLRSIVKTLGPDLAARSCGRRCSPASCRSPRSARRRSLRCRGRHPSSSAPTRCSATTSSSSTSGSSSSTSSTASASTSARPCG